MRVLAQDAAGPPRGQRPSGAPIAVVGLVAERVVGQVQADDVRLVARQQAGVLIGADDVVRRGDHEGEIADGGRIEAQGAEGSDLGHGTFG